MMTQNISAQLRQYINEEASRQASAFLGENKHNMEAAIAQIIAVCLGGLTAKVRNKKEANSLFNLLNLESSNGNILNNVPRLFGGGYATHSLINNGQSLMRFVFDENTGDLAELIASTSSVNRLSARSLFNMVMPIAIGFLSRKKRNENFDVDELTRLLQGQKEYIKDDLPTGFYKLINHNFTQNEDKDEDETETEKLSLEEKERLVDEKIAEEQRKAASYYETREDDIDAKPEAAEEEPVLAGGEMDRASSGGGSNWWKYVLPLLIIFLFIPLLLPFMKKNDSYNGTIQNGTSANQQAENFSEKNEKEALKILPKKDKTEGKEDETSSPDTIHKELHNETQKAENPSDLNKKKSTTVIVTKETASMKKKESPAKQDIADNKKSEQAERVETFTYGNPLEYKTENKKEEETKGTQQQAAATKQDSKVETTANVTGQKSFTFSDRSPEGQLASLLSGQSLAKANFVLDKVRFQDNSTNMDANSNQQLNNIADVLKAYPNSQLQIKGYSGLNGNPNNIRSQAENIANNVKSYLVQQGVPPGRLSSYGLASNAPQTKVEIVVTKRN